MLIVTINEIPGKKLEALGVVRGSTVQSRNFGHDLMAGFRTLVGGEVTDYADMLIIVDEGRIRFADTPDAVLAHSEELLALGVNVPRSTTLMNALSAQGLYAGPTVRNVAGAAAALKEVLA